MSRPTLSIRLEADEFPCEHVQVAAFSGKEAIGRLFSFDLEIVCTDRAALDRRRMVGALVTIVMERDRGGGAVDEIRRIHGMIAAVEDMLDPQAAFRTFRLRVVPRAHRLGLVETQDIFLHKSLPEIIALKTARAGLRPEDVELRLLAEYPPLDFVIQYKETDLAFLSRLCEHRGISITFEHTGGGDRLIFTDDNARLTPIEGSPRAAFQPRGERRDVYRISATTRAIPAVFVQQDYEYRTPRLDLTAQHKVDTGYGGGLVEYGAHYATPEDGARLARIRGEEQQATYEVFEGAGDVVTFRAGARFTLEGHPLLDEVELLLVEVEHEARQAALVHGAGGDAPTYENRFRAILAGVPYRPPRRTPKPRIAGVLSGRVEPQPVTMGNPEGVPQTPPDDEIGKHAEIDDMGRYTVRFFFDGNPLGNRHPSSLPVRMAQPHAGPNYGMHFPLKPGIEVLVAFEDGDPDRPIIVGSIPNPITPSPVTRPNAIMNRIETVSGIFIEMKDV
jgi:type VI secretion system secreted protein VgrG